MSERPEHPGEMLRRVMQERDISVSQLCAVGLPIRWVNDLLRRWTEIDTHEPHVQRTRLLAKVTGVPVAEWIETQRAWRNYRQRRYTEMESQRRREKVRN